MRFISSEPSAAFLHCKEDPIYVFQEMKLRGLVPNFHIHVSVSNLYIPRIDPPILLQQYRQTNPETSHRYINWQQGSAVSFWNICYEFSVQCPCSVYV